MLKDFKPRLYQQTIFGVAAKENTLVVLPTGMGKTAISLMLAAQRLKEFPNYKILILAPTRPLCEQHLETFKKHLDTDGILLFTGKTSPSERAKLWSEAKVVVSTPQGLENDVISGRIKVEEISLIVFDEAHKAVSDYAYVFIADQYLKRARRQRVLALTASPGHDIDKIIEVCDNLGIDDLEIRDENDPDVKPYIQDVKINWVSVEFTEELKRIQKYLSSCFQRKVKSIQAYGMLKNFLPSKITRTQLLKFQSRIYGEVAKGNKNFEMLKSMSLLAEAMKVSHALELLESQGIHSLHLYLDGIQKDAARSKVKAVKNLVVDTDFRSALLLTKSMMESNVEHPKIKEVKRIILKTLRKKDQKVIVFTQYRDTADHLVNEFNNLKNVNSKIEAKLFVGQTKKNGTGLSQKKQKEILDDFRESKFNVLVSTSVGEEGLDIPQVDLVLFYEPVPSAIRTIQRRGRTGRLESGKVITLVTKGTRDEAYRWSAHHKENRMKRVLLDLKRKIKPVERQEKPKTLTDFDGDRVYIFADTREKGSKAIKLLLDRNVKIQLLRLDMADYVLSSRCGVEFKTIPDFVDSLVDGRLLSQIKSLKETYLRPLLIVEGTEDIYSQRKVNPAAINGMIATITVSYGIPIIYTKNSKETADMLHIIAKREQSETSKDFNPHSAKKRENIRDQQEYVVSSIPSVGPGLAKQLLEQFGSIKNIVEADIDELKKVEKIGNIKAKLIKEILEKEYQKL